MPAAPVTYVLDTVLRTSIHRSAVDMAIKDRASNLSYIEKGALQAEARSALPKLSGAFAHCSTKGLQQAVDLWVQSYLQIAEVMRDLGARDGYWRAD